MFNASSVNGRSVAQSAWDALRLLLVACLVAAASPHAAAKSAEDRLAAEVSTDLEKPLYSFNTRYYTVHSNLDKKLAKRAALHLDRFHVVYRELLSSVPGKPEGRQRVFLFANHENYQLGLKRLGGDPAILKASGGMFWPGNGSANLAGFLYGGGERGFEQMIETLQHEGFHQFAYAKIGGELPHWVNEGLAGYFEIAELKGRRIKRGLLRRSWLSELQSAQRRGDLLPFDELLKLDHASWGRNMTSGSNGHLQYLQSWITTHFLLHGDGGRYKKRFGAYLRLLAEGSTSSEAFRAAFETDDTTSFGQAVDAFIAEAEPD